MVLVNTTIDDPSSLIQYNPPAEWVLGDPVGDPEGFKYSNGGTFTATTSQGAYASFVFNGTGVWIFGAKRSNHGPYTVQLDNQSFSGTGIASGDGVFQTPLFGAQNLTDGLHNVTITNEGSGSTPFLDIDFIIWETEIGADNDKLSSTTIQDTDASFSYNPASAWSTSPGNLTQYSNDTGHVTSSAGATVAYTFTGDAVSLFGTVGPQNAPYTVQVDSGSVQSFNASRFAFHAQQMIYYADTLGPGQHTITLTNQPAASGQGLTIDFATVSTVPTTASSKSLSAGAIGGISFAIIAVIGILGALGWLLYKRRKRSRQFAPKVDLMASPVQQSSSATLPSFYSTQQLTANAAPAPSTYPSTVPTQSSYATGGPYPSSTSPPSTYTTSAYPASAYPTSNYPTSAYPTSVAAPSSFAQGEPIYGYQGAQYGYNEQDVPVTAYDDRSIMTREPSTNIGHRRQQSSVSVNLPNPYPDTQRDISMYRTDSTRRPLPTSPDPQLPPPLPPKGSAPQLPATASQILSHYTSDELTRSRMVVQGRPQDFGHVPVEGELPPPNYAQAVQPGPSTSRQR